MTILKTPPSRDEIITMVVDNMYSDRILNNAHRGDVAEMIVLSALGPGWRSVGLGWHPWDLQRGSGSERVRIQVKQCAALQLWGKTKRLGLKFGWKKKAPDYFAKYNPGEKIESEGWFCDLFVFGLHLEENINKADQLDPKQWKFLVIPTNDLKRGQDSMVLTEALKRWRPVIWCDLLDEVECAIESAVGRISKA